MIITNIGNFYHNYFNKNLKPFNYIKDQDGFNMSACNIESPINSILFCVRFLGPIQAYFGESFIPGNYSENKQYFQSLYPFVSFGENFFWNAWCSSLIDNTIFFVGKYQNNKLIIDESIKPLIIKDRKALTKLDYNLKYTDIRLINLNNKIYCYDALISSIFQLKIVDNTILLSFNLTDKEYKQHSLSSYNKICDNSLENTIINNIAKTPYDKNWSLVDIINNKFFFLNWFEKSYLTCTLVNLNKKECEKINLIKMNGDIIDGYGSNQSPLFSFGTPCLKLQTDKNTSVYIGAGHIKIILSYKYKNPKIINFINNIQSIKHISHTSYVYTMYLFKFTINNNKFKFEISDSILIMNKSNLKYQFSINFPIGIFKTNSNNQNDINISYGYGDYYNMIMTVTEDEFLNMCKHDISSFNFDNYEYLLYV